ncbi:hypothetical protein DY000_02000954 [Brassica cretica]|uniref:PORR domain-containing protein n=1 Tax=Brassica cretica TaxID=69181 RepID=A0ABQ7C901_BRACR|nr:hypothetical protein DY000_02000954 [Brassica cretica]
MGFLEPLYKQQDEENIQTPFSETNLLGSLCGCTWTRSWVKAVGSKEFEKRAVAVMYELLSFTLEKRLVTTDHLTHFRRVCGIFYVSERGKRFSVLFTEAYEGQELIEKCPLILWKEKLLRFTGYRGRKRDIPNDDDEMDSDEATEEGREIFRVIVRRSGDEGLRVGFEKNDDDMMSDDDDEMDSDEVNDEYEEKCKILTKG